VRIEKGNVGGNEAKVPLQGVQQYQDFMSVSIRKY